MWSKIICFVAVIACAHAISLKIPKIPAADDLNIFTPGSFPCAYTARFKIDMKQEEQDIHGEGFQSMWGNYISMHYEGSTQGMVYTQVNIMRPDIKEEGKDKSAALFYAMLGMCDLDGYVDSYEDGYGQISYIYYLIGMPIAYEEKKSATWEGQQCTLYRANVSESLTEIYADSDNHVIGAIVEYTGYYIKASMSYKNEAYVDDFVLPTSYSGCEETSAVYSDPEPVQNCKIPHTRPDPTSESASAVRAFIFIPLVLAAIMAAFISFF